MTLVQIGRPGPPAWLAWSGGKNAAHLLHLARSSGSRVAALLTLIDPEGRALGSEVGRPLIEAQARSAGLPVLFARWEEAPGVLEEAEAKALLFGDAQGSPTLDLHRELARAAGLEPRFPLAEGAPEALAEAILEAGVRSVITAVDRSRAPRAWVGRTFSASLLDERPSSVHPTGGRGELHTFACGGPALAAPISPRWEALEHIGTWAYARLGPGPRRGYGG